MRTQRFFTLAGAGLAALFLSATALSAKTFVYCSEGSPENFSPAKSLAIDGGEGFARVVAEDLPNGTAFDR